MVAPRIRAQAGWFTVHHFDSDQEKFIALENDAIYGSRLTKLIIPGTVSGDPELPGLVLRLAKIW